MPPRPYLKLTIVELEEIFRTEKTKASVLAKLIVELAHRTVPRAKRLEKQVLRALSTKKPVQKPSKIPPASDKLLTVAEHRQVAAHLRAKEADWSNEERQVALQYAKLHDFLADLIERRSQGAA